MLITIGILTWLVCFYLNKDGYIIPKIGGGCFGGGSKQPTLNIPAPQKLPTAEELFAAATNFGKTNSPLAYGAREGALSDLSRGNDYYNQFQPTSFEQALGNQYFQNVFPNQERTIKHALSLSGIESSPVLADQLGKAMGQTQFDIGSFLSNQGNERATNSLNSRLGIDPSSTYNNYLNTDVNQSTNQANQQYQYELAKAQQDYQNALQKYNNQQSMFRTIGQISPIGGLLYGGAAGGGTGALSSLGGSVNTLQQALPFMLSAGMGGGLPGMGGGGQGFQSALGMGQQAGYPNYGYGQTTPQGTQNMGGWSMFPQTAMKV